MLQVRRISDELVLAGVPDFIHHRSIKALRQVAKKRCARLAGHSGARLSIDPFK
jgi:hypothetical protein